MGEVDRTISVLSGLTGTSGTDEDQSHALCFLSAHCSLLTQLSILLLDFAVASMSCMTQSSARCLRRLSQPGRDIRT